jgi:glucose/arabinose dehydrogenase
MTATARQRSTVVAIAVALIVTVPADIGTALPRATRVTVYKRGLNFPIDMAWVPGTKKIFFTEKNTGEVRVMTGRRLRARPCVDLDVDATGERGALGIALHPRFATNPKLYVFYTNASPLENRVTRFEVRRNRCRRPRHIVRGLDVAPSGYHNGGQLEFVGDHLFVATGDAHEPGRAQSRRDRHGKILRVGPAGVPPRSNPFSGARGRNPVWSYGHRNPFGLARKPGTARLFATENGPSCDDELNRIRKGRNYGWGEGYACGTRGVGRRPRGPVYRWASPVVPTDPWWYRGRLRRLSNALYVGDFATGRLHRFNLGSGARREPRHRVIARASDGIVDVAKGPGGWLYYMTRTAMFRIVRRPR